MFKLQVWMKDKNLKSMAQNRSSRGSQKKIFPSKGEMLIQILETQRTLTKYASQKNTKIKKETPHGLLQLKYTECTERCKRKPQVAYTGKAIRITVHFSMETLKAKRA